MRDTTYLQQINETLKEYVEGLIISNPDKYASDGANNRLVEQYIIDIGIDSYKYMATTVHSITRIKSRFLEMYPELDRRILESGKKTPVKSNDK